MTPYVADVDFTLHVGDALETLRTLPDESVDCVVTSPPYWGLRDYGTGEWEGGDENCDHADAKVKGRADYGFSEAAQVQTSNVSAGYTRYKDECSCGARRVDQQLGLEPTPDAYVARMVEVFREVRRVLAPHGTCWVNLGDSYAGGGYSNHENTGGAQREDGGKQAHTRSTALGLKPKDLVGVPWKVALALQQPWMRCSLCGEERAGHQWGQMPPTGAFPMGYVVCPACSCPSPSPEITTPGWYLRSDIIWSKPNPMPESVTDRPTKAHEYVFLLTKSPRYWFDQEAVREPHTMKPQRRLVENRTSEKHIARVAMSPHRAPDYYPRDENGVDGNPAGRNIRSVWEIATQPYPEAHFATFPEELARRCILAGCPVRVCRVCGKPSERIVEVARVPRSSGGPSPAHTEVKGYSPSSAMVTNALPQTTTLGWSDCRCKRIAGHEWEETREGRTHLLNDWRERDKWRPGVVLDPFLGSGTTALVARNHGRHAIGIELSQEYAELAARRTRQLSLLTEAQPTRDLRRPDYNPATAEIPY